MTEVAQLQDRLSRAVAPQYEISGVVGAGGCAVVFHARDAALDRDVAIKALKPQLDSPAIRERFRREGAATAKLQHPNVIAIHGVGEGDELSWIVMPLVRGESLAARIERSGRLAASDVVPLLLDVADGLACAHAAGMVHRDVKPENVLLDAATGRAILTDFGVAKALDGIDESLTATGIVLGTPSAMAPEQLAGDAPVDLRTDVWAFGVLAYRALTGELPFSAPSVTQLVGRIIAGTPAPITAAAPDCPAWLVDVVMRCLAKDATERYPDAGAVATALRDGREGRASVRLSAAAAAPTPASWPAAARGAWRTALVAAAVVAVVWVLEWRLAAVRITPFVALAGLLIVALAVAERWTRANQATAQADAPPPSAGRRHRNAIATERRIVSAILLQMPRVERAKLASVLPTMDQALAEADRLLAQRGASPRDALAALADGARAVRLGLEQRAGDQVVRAVASLSGETRSARTG
ncbi:MAG: serine/threonine-protein kinase [Gemmatimonadaceae bacterium]|nr:serine/threonine-protein kinase [Gemmatimonadaceae bacterium]